MAGSSLEEDEFLINGENYCQAFRAWEGKLAERAVGDGQFQADLGRHLAGVGDLGLGDLYAASRDWERAIDECGGSCARRSARRPPDRRCFRPLCISMLLFNRENPGISPG